MNNTYLALTIGPIYKTMKLARKTREFWAASLLFSLLAKELCTKLKENGIAEGDFLVPYKSIFSRDMKNIGLYLDRIICKANPALWENLEKNVIDKALKSLSEIVSKVTPGLTIPVLKSYFKIYAVIKDVEDGKPAIADISNHLNTLELYNVEDSLSHDNLIKHFLENVNTDYDDEGQIGESDNFLKHYFDRNDYNGKIRIPSITEIALKSFYCGTEPVPENDPLKMIFKETVWKKKANENKLFEMLKESFSKKVKNYHKYICILQADGDKLGSNLMKMGAGEIERISKDLIEWGEQDALILVQEYGGLPIYIGGDDVLCFVPVAVDNIRNILELAEKLNTSYRNKPAIKAIGSTLSIGIKIAYYKSPMYESYIDTFTLLNDIAKKYKNKEANSCCISLEKHSGQPHQFVFSFDKEIKDEKGEPLVIKGEYGQFVKLLFKNMVADEKKKSFITSVFYKLRANEDLIALISPDKERLWHFFENNFDEARPRKKGSAEYDYLKAIHDYLFFLFDRYKIEKIKEHDIYITTNELYSALKTIRFIKGLDYDND